VHDLPEELQPIAVRLNELLARLQESFARERRFSADLAHELRTPIAELRSLAECALKWPESRDSATDQDMLAIARHMESLTTSMLALTRGETGQLAGQIGPVNFSTLIEETWSPFAARAAARGLKVNKVLPPTVVSADPALLRSILSNLFDNAADYATEGGQLDLVVQVREPGVVFQIANPTVNLAAEDMAKLFDPFWRKEAARSGGRHFGLGLALARTFATAMGWTLTAELDREKRVVLRLSGSGLPEKTPRRFTTTCRRFTHLMSPRPHFFAGFSLLVLLVSSTLRAQQPDPVPPPAPASDEKELHKVSGIFDTDLPKTEKKGRIRVIIHPHLGDLTRRSYIRVPLGIRWGVNDHVESRRRPARSPRPLQAPRATRTPHCSRGRARGAHTVSRRWRAAAHRRSSAAAALGG